MEYDASCRIPHAGINSWSRLLFLLIENAFHCSSAIYLFDFYYFAEDVSLLKNSLSKPETNISVDLNNIHICLGAN